jgi:hypothetical protein
MKDKKDAGFPRFLTIDDPRVSVIVFYLPLIYNI